MTLKNTNAKVYIQSDITANGETTHMQLVSDAKYRQRNDKYYIMYEESITDDMKKGITTVRVEQDRISIKRAGAFESTMLYQQGKNNTCLYNFEHGRIVIENYTHAITKELGDQGGWIDLRYELDMGGAKSDNHIYITIGEVTEFDHNY